jgi:hypothetical protein
MSATPNRNGALAASNPLLDPSSIKTKTDIKESSAA